MNYATYFTPEQIEELKQIAEKISELEAKKMSCQMSGNLDGAMSAQKGLRFAKDYFSKREQSIKASARRRAKGVNVQ